MMSEPAEQRAERITQHLIEARGRIEEDIAGTEDIFMRRIEADVATVVTLSIIKELLPDQVREQVQAIIDLHEEVWNADSAGVPGITPRKPLGSRLLDRISTFMHTGEGKPIPARRLSFFSRQQG